MKNDDSINKLPSLRSGIFERSPLPIVSFHFVIEFNYRPLVSAWMKLTDDEKEIAHLRDIAMDGERGIASSFPGFNPDIEKTIANSDDGSRPVFTINK